MGKALKSSKDRGFLSVDVVFVTQALFLGGDCWSDKARVDTSFSKDSSSPTSSTSISESIPVRSSSLLCWCCWSPLSPNYMAIKVYCVTPQVPDIYSPWDHQYSFEGKQEVTRPYHVDHGNQGNWFSKKPGEALAVVSIPLLACQCMH